MKPNHQFNLEYIKPIDTRFNDHISKHMSHKRNYTNTIGLVVVIVLILFLLFLYIQYSLQYYDLTSESKLLKYQIGAVNKQISKMKAESNTLKSSNEKMKNQNVKITNEIVRINSDNNDMISHLNKIDLDIESMKQEVMLKMESNAEVKDNIAKNEGIIGDFEAQEELGTRAINRLHGQIVFLKSKL